MNFSVYGPYELPRQNGLIDSTAKAKRLFWADVEANVPGLPEACGCYIFVVRANRAGLPWYVGLTTKRSFNREAIGAHQVNHYNQAIAKKKVSVETQLYFLAKETPKGRFAKPSKNPHRDIEFLETFMFGIALN